MADFTWCACYGFTSGPRVPSTALAVWLTADKNVYVSLVILDANWRACWGERVEWLIRILRLPNVWVQWEPRGAFLEISVTISDGELKTSIGRPRQMTYRTLKTKTEDCLKLRVDTAARISRENEKYQVSIFAWSLISIKCKRTERENFHYRDRLDVLVDKHRAWVASIDYRCWLQAIEIFFVNIYSVVLQDAKLHSL